jgi:hypothetical protein
MYADVKLVGNINNEEIHLYISKGIGLGISIVNTMHMNKEY